MTTPRDRLIRFLEHLDGIFRVEPDFYPIESVQAELPKTLCMVYRDIPEPGWITGVTFGLSEGEHAEWLGGHPELMISIASSDLSWPLAIAELANRLRGRCPFCYGDVIHFGGPMASDSEMSAFFVFVPAILERRYFADIDVGAEYPIHIAGMYPLYDSERAVIGEIGLESFMEHPHYDMYAVDRPAVVLNAKW